MISGAIFLEAKITAWFVKNAGDLLAWKQSNQDICLLISIFIYWACETILKQ